MFVVTSKSVSKTNNFEELKKLVSYYINNDISYKLTTLLFKVEDIKKELSTHRSK